MFAPPKKEVEKYSDLIHVDIMDGIFVPPTTVDSNFVKKIKTKVISEALAIFLVAIKLPK